MDTFGAICSPFLFRLVYDSGILSKFAPSFYLMAGIYVHIPFCASRCSYCDFFSTLKLEEMGANYIKAVLVEASLRQGELRGESLRTLYLGGGTPSQLPVPLLTRLVNGLRKQFELDGVEEFTIEANPDDVTPSWCAALPPLGVNRVSMGVQSFEDPVLKFIGRRHTSRQVVEAVSNLRSVGIDNISIDLIYGLPGQTLDSWTSTVEQAVSLNPKHISAYGLTYEEGTRLWLQRENGEITEIPEEICLKMYSVLIERLSKSGFEHYEISNFALPGFHSRHNSSYWDETPYLGLGAAAHSYDGVVRRSNPCDLSTYIADVTSGKLACDVEALTRRERFDERVMLGLRTSRGVDADRLRADYGEQAWRHFTHGAERYIAAGKMRVVDDNRYVLTADGIMLSDSIIRDLMWDD